jgi:DNA-binding response OmpR family regulator
MNVLVIEDEQSLQDSIKKYLDAGDYHCEVASTFDQAEEKINLYTYDCILVDITLPDGNGLDIIRELKVNRINSGIIIISARNSLDDKVVGLDIGADDYLTKPFDLAELNARINAVIRRKSFDGKDEIDFNEIKIIMSTRQVYIGKSEVRLTKKEFDLLKFLIANKGRIITKETIAEHLWGDHMDLADSFDFIYVHIKNLRKKIVESGGADYIQSVYGIGYKMIDD